MISALYIGFGGFLGALFRSLLVRIIPYSNFNILIINLLGCFLFGFLISKVHDLELRLFIFSGFLASMTTFSTFISELSILIESKSLAKASFYLLAHVFIGLFFFSLGKFFARSI